MEGQVNYYSLDEIISVSVSEDRLDACIQFQKVEEGLKLRARDLEDLLAQHGVVYGIRKDVLDKIVASPEQYRIDQIVVARGDAPINGENGFIRMLYNLERERAKPTQMEDGTVDYREINQLNNVQKGQPIAERIAPKEGTPGKAVTGEVLIAKNGKEAQFKLGKNVVTDKEKNTMYAAIDGLVTKTDRDKVNVFPVYEVNGDIDYSVGNIDFVGTVVIRGNVLPGFKVKAAGDIRVVGGVEAGELFAEGSIEITEGILGQNKGVVIAGKNVKTSFVQDAEITAKEDVLVSQSIMHSHVRAGANVICHGTKGLIVGGIVQAGEKVKARTVGNTMSTATVIEVGVLPELREELGEVRGKLRESKDNLDKTEKALTLLDQLAASGQLSGEKLAMRIRLTNSKKQTLEEIDELKERVIEIEKSLEGAVKAEVEVTATIYAGTKVVIGRYTRFVKDPVRMVKFCINEGEVTMLSHTSKG